LEYESLNTGSVRGCYMFTTQRVQVCRTVEVPKRFHVELMGRLSNVYVLMCGIEQK